MFLETLHIENIKFSPDENPIFHPGKCAAVYCNEVKIGVFGEIHPKTLEKFDSWKTRSTLPILIWMLFSRICLIHSHSRPVYTFPPVLEDLAIIVPTRCLPNRWRMSFVPPAEVCDHVTLFDVFKGEQIGSERRAGIQLDLSAFDRTLTDKNVEKAREKIIKALESQLQALVRRNNLTN